MSEDAENLVERVTRQLAEIRKSAKITQDTLAARLEIPVQHVRRIEGGRQNVTLETLQRFAVALGVRVEVLFTVDAEGPRKPAPSKRQQTKTARTTKT